MLVWQRAGEDQKELLAHLLPDPDRVLASGEPLPGRGRGCTTARVTIAGNDYLLKRFAYRSVWYGLRHMFKRSRALKVFVNQNLAHQAGVCVPRPLLCLEERCCRFLRRGYVLDRYLRESQPLDQCWDGLSAAHKDAVLRLAADSYRQLHQAGLLHGDSNWRNLLVTHSAGPQIWLIDFDNSSRSARLPDRWRRRDVSHFLRDMHWRQLSGEAVDDFCSTVGISLPDR
jgi:tRNA A-37 threonylcarbamoyl transferase component Bud32